MRRAAGIACLALVAGCKDRARSPMSGLRGEFEERSARASYQTSDDGPVRVEERSPREKPPMFVMRGGPRGPSRIVFLHGMCGHALGYAQAFQYAAATKGTLIAPQGDRACGDGPWSSWSNDIDALDHRIVTTFRALGFADPDDIVAIGYSQGASRAEALARKWPGRYTRLVLIAAPTLVSPQGLGSLRAAVTMAGELDRQDLMKKGVGVLLAAGIPTTYMMIPQATHGAMGPTPEKTMGQSLDWLWEHQKPDDSAITLRTDPTHLPR
jgi:pimeloyl-ACP methyl ester carboxylesterase